jgi:hypothetical protein
MVNVAWLQDVVMVDKSKLFLIVKATERAALAAKHAADICGRARQQFMSEVVRLEDIATELRGPM